MKESRRALLSQKSAQNWMSIAPHVDKTHKMIGNWRSKTFRKQKKLRTEVETLVDIVKKCQEEPDYTTGQMNKRSNKTRSDIAEFNGAFSTALNTLQENLSVEYDPRSIRKEDSEMYFDAHQIMMD